MVESKLASALIAALADPDSAGDTSFLLNE
jgi:hypothetical protein